MILCLTGLIGSGKSTYALEHAEDDHEIIDWDKIHNDFKPEDRQVAKQIIIDLLEEAVSSDKITWFVCNIPSKEHQELLDKTEVKYLWLYSEIPWTLDNVKRRDKKRDIEHLQLIYLKNVEILSNSDKFIKKYKVKVIR